MNKVVLVLHFHGLGPVPGPVGPVERHYWCDRERFNSILNCIMLTARVPVELTFDDGNISDLLLCCLLCLIGA
jgi:hypothetical protein